MNSIKSFVPSCIARQEEPVETLTVSSYEPSNKWNEEEDREDGYSVWRADQTKRRQMDKDDKEERSEYMAQQRNKAPSTDTPSSSTPTATSASSTRVWYRRQRIKALSRFFFSFKNKHH